MSKEAIKHYESALKEAFPSGATGDVFFHWNEARKAPKTNPPLYSGGYVEGVMAERQRIVNLLMLQHEAAKGAHNYWHVAAQLIQADVASDT